MKPQLSRPEPPRPAAAWTSRPLFGRWPGWTWVCAVIAFVASYAFMFGVIHPLVDTRPCAARFTNDPLMKIFAATKKPYFITHTLYSWFTVLGVLSLALRAVRGDQAPLLRFGIALSLQALFRSLTLWLAPLCRASMAPGTIPLSVTPTLDLGFVQIPWRMWGTNDLLFSGHVGEFFLLYLATRRVWPRWAIVGLCVFQIAQAISLVVTRGHYTLDVVVAVPFAFSADAIACAFLRYASRGTLVQSGAPRHTTP